MGLYESLASVYDELFPLNQACLAFIDRLAAGGELDRRVLDVGSATGSLSLALASRSWDTVAVEPSPSMMALARHKAGAKGAAPLEFIEADMLSAGASLVEEGRSGFGLVLCLGNTLPHLENLDEVGRFLGLCRLLIAPRGALVLQLLNFSLIGAGFAFPDLSSSDMVFGRRYAALPGWQPDRRLCFRTELSPQAGQGAGHAWPHAGVMLDETAITPIPPPWLLGAIKGAGFASAEAFSAWDAAAFQEARDPYLIVVARRAAS